MTKLNQNVYRKLTAQAAEAKNRGLVKLAESIVEAVGDDSSEQPTEYSYAQLTEDVQKDLWKLATKIMVYYDVKSVNAEKVHEAVVHAASQVMEDLEDVLTIEQSVGPLEPKVPGENK